MDTQEALKITQGYSYGKNHFSVYTPKGSILYSYGTPVAIRKDGRIYQGDSHSRTTQKHITQWASVSAIEKLPQTEFCHKLESLFR